MVSFNWFLSKPTIDITVLHIFNNLPPKFCCESVVLVASYTLKIVASFFKINKSFLRTLTYFAIGRGMKLCFPILFLFISKNYTTIDLPKKISRVITDIHIYIYRWNPPLYEREKVYTYK